MIILQKKSFPLERFLAILLILIWSSLPCYAQQIHDEKPLNVDTIANQSGAIIISRFERQVKKSEKIFRTKLKVIVKDKQSNRLLPLSFVGIDKAMFQTGENATAILYVEKGKYKLSANTLGYNTLVYHLKISLHYNYEIEMFLSRKTDSLY